MKILIVDDDFISLEILKKYFSEFGDVEITENGRLAIKRIDSALKNDTPYDLICLDIVMSEINGIEALKIIRQLEDENGKNNFDRSKILITTTINYSNMIIEAFQNKCDGYLIKPIDKNKLYDILNNIGLL